jgi:hypothetical protein
VLHAARRVIQALLASVMLAEDSLNFKVISSSRYIDIWGRILEKGKMIVLSGRLGVFCLSKPFRRSVQVPLPN